MNEWIINNKGDCPWESVLFTDWMHVEIIKRDPYLPGDYLKICLLSSPHPPPLWRFPGSKLKRAIGTTPHLYSKDRYSQVKKQKKTQTNKKTREEIKHSKKEKGQAMLTIFFQSRNIWRRIPNSVLLKSVVINEYRNKNTHWEACPNSQRPS